jgi:hypothetical protein
MANSVTSISNPTLFAQCPSLPDGFHYKLDQIGTYVFGQMNPLYQISIVRDSDNLTFTGNAFAPSTQYEGVTNMLYIECQNVINQFEPYNYAETLHNYCVELIGF